MKNLTPAELAAVGAVDRDRIAADLAAVVAHRSLTGAEGEVQTEIALRMTTAGLDVERVDMPAHELASDPDFPGVEVPRDTHPVVAGRLGDRERGPRAIIAGHVDVVGAGDELQWTTPPFEPRIDDGRLYGRGSCDMKAGVVAGLAALRAIVESGVEPAGEAILLTVPGEEDGGAGMLAAIRSGYAGGVAVITEPTDLQIVTAQAGAITFTLTIQGRSAHAAFRREGVSAIEKLWPIMRALEQNERERNEAEQLRSMRELGLPYPTSIGRVGAGEWCPTGWSRRGASACASARPWTRPRRSCGRSSPGPARATTGYASTRPTSRSPAGVSARPPSPTIIHCPGGSPRRRATSSAGYPTSSACRTVPTPAS
jgi:acetylornithine deacetylase